MDRDLPLEERLRQELESDKRRWQFPKFEPGGEARLFESPSDLFHYAYLPGEYRHRLIEVEMPASEGSTGCTIYGLQRRNYPADTVFFAYKERGVSKITPVPPRIEARGDKVVWISGNDTSVMYERTIATK